MLGVGGKVEFPPVTVKLHWPSVWCEVCTGDTERIAHEMYQCMSCSRVDNGHNKYLTGTVIPCPK